MIKYLAILKSEVINRLSTSTLRLLIEKPCFNCKRALLITKSTWDDSLTPTCPRCSDVGERVILVLPNDNELVSSAKRDIAECN